MYLELHRTSQDAKQTLGHLYVMNELHLCFNIFATLELPWRGNQRNLSCIPAGVYHVKKRWSLKYGNHLHVLDVNQRSMILIHAGNYFFNTQGCILVGTGTLDLNKDKRMDIVNSRNALEQLLNSISGNSTTMHVKDLFKIDIA